MAETKNFRGGVVALGLLALCAIGGLAYLAARPGLQPTPAAPAPPAAPQAATVQVPQFDIVRVDPSGNLVLAGRAAPGATVTIKSGDTVLGTVTADAGGAFALVPENPLLPGALAITLSETLPGGKIIPGPATVSIDVPASAGGQALAVASGPGASKVLSGQGPQAGHLGIGTVDYDADGHAIFSGTAPAGDHVSLALGGEKIGEAVAGPDGRWTLAASVPHNDGTLNLTDSATAAPVTAPFALETLPDAVASGHVVIAPGQNLWLIARHVYGHGNMYTLIYSANSRQIQDPNLIFPGQAFALPKPQG